MYNDITETKICRKCKEEQPLTEFYKVKSTRDRKSTQCITCQFASTRLPRLATPYALLKERAGSVYFLHCEITNLVKIGCTLDVEKRMSHFQTMSPVPLTLIGCGVGYTLREGVLHDKFSHLRHHGEWFRLTEELLDYIMREVD